MIIAAKGLHFPALPVNGDLPLQRLFWGESLVLKVCLETCRLSLEVVPINKHKQIAPIAKENTAQEHPAAEPPIPVEGSEERRNNICKAARGIHATAAAERSHQLGLAQSGSVSTVSGNNGFSIRKKDGSDHADSLRNDLLS